MPLFQMIIYVFELCKRSILTKNKLFQLPPKKEIQETNFEVVLVDVTESPIQRPKKNKEIGILENKENTHRRYKLEK